MYQQLVRNEDGEPMYIENVMDAQEEREFWLEEMQMRADDPMYAAMREKEEWIAKATKAFEDAGVEVPYSVKEAWVREVRAIQRKNDEEKQLAQARPVVDLINKIIPYCKCEACYYSETPDECAYVELHFGKEPAREDVEKVYEVAGDDERYEWLGDYLGSPRHYKTRKEQHFREFSCKIQYEVIFKHEFGTHIKIHAEFDGKTINEIWWDRDKCEQMILLEGDSEPKMMRDYTDYIETIYEQIKDYGRERNDSCTD